MNDLYRKKYKYIVNLTSVGGGHRRKTNNLVIKEKKPGRYNIQEVRHLSYLYLSDGFRNLDSNREIMS
ncbi:MAG: hypothetical protein ACRD8W_05685 [Nitrososphaeraceae archaeon]